MNYTKYLDIELNQVIIIKNIKYETQSSMRLLNDNQSINFLIKNAHIHERSKHIDVIYHHIRDLHHKNLIKLNYVFNEDMMIDDLTKSLSNDKFKRFVTQLSLRESKINES